MATYVPTEMYLSSQQQQQQQHPCFPMGYPNELSPTQPLQYPSSPPPNFDSSLGNGAVAASVINHRVFVGSLQVDVTEEIIKKVFEKVEPKLPIRDIKIVRESNGQSKGYGFVTYANEEDAQKVINKPPGAFGYKTRQWNIAPAVRRFPPLVAPSNVLYYPYSPGVYSVSNGVVNSNSGLVSYLPQQLYASPSPYLASPLMQQSRFVFPPQQQQQRGAEMSSTNFNMEYPPLGQLPSGNNGAFATSPR
jgi:RNA recognition motif-containing protein